MKSDQAERFPGHPSYRTHRRQLWTQILLPVLIAALVFVAGPIVGWLTVLGGQGELGRWAAISTMWTLVPAMIGGAILLVALIALILASNRISAWVPRFSVRAQQIADQTASAATRAAGMIQNPILALRGFGSMIRSGFSRLRERV